MNDLADMFAAEVAEEESGLLAAASAPLERHDTYADPDDGADLDTSAWFSVCVLAVPDLSRFPLPKEFSDSKVAVDLSSLATMAGGDVRKLIQASLPDDQLAEIETAEKVREKPRGIVLKAVDEEHASRGPEYRQWVEWHANNPLCVQIASVAWQVGDSEIVVVSPDSTRQESAALDQLRSDWRGFCRASGFDRVACWNLDFVMQVITARRVCLGVLDPYDADFRPCLPISGRNWLLLSQQAGGLAAAAAAFGIVEHEIPKLPSCLDVFRAFRSEAGAVQLSDWCVERLTLEREVLRVTQGLW